MQSARGLKPAQQRRPTGVKLKDRATSAIALSAEPPFSVSRTARGWTQMSFMKMPRRLWGARFLPATSARRKCGVYRKPKAKPHLQYTISASSRMRDTKVRVDTSTKGMSHTILLEPCRGCLVMLEMLFSSVGMGQPQVAVMDYTETLTDSSYVFPSIFPHTIKRRMTHDNSYLLTCKKSMIWPAFSSLWSWFSIWHMSADFRNLAKKEILSRTGTEWQPWVECIHLCYLSV